VNESSTAPGHAPQGKAHRIEEVVAGVLERLLTIVFMGIFALVVVLVVLRYVFNTTIVGGNEATVMLFIYTTALGSAVEVARGKHIIVDSFVNFLPVRVRYWLGVVNLGIVAVLHGFLLKFSFDWVGAVGGSEHPVLHVPEGVVQVAMPIGCALTVLFCLTRIVIAVNERPAAPR
jgi:TRAP-type C4-dicarboxylate transport system permease small subunit